LLIGFNNNFKYFKVLLVTMILNQNPREEKGKQIANSEGQLFRVVDNYYKVKSQSVDRYYDVNNTTIGWKCNCPDHKFRGTKCKHIWAVQISLGFRNLVKKNLVLEPITAIKCESCNSSNVRKAGIQHNKSGDVQRYRCKVCGRIFSVNIGFKFMKHSPQSITTAMQLYFSGESLRNTQRSLQLMGTEVSHQTISNWIKKYTTIMKNYVDKIGPNLSSTWRADEVWIKVKGDLKYLFALMDDETRYWIAQEVADTKDKHDARQLFNEGKEIAGKRPETLITDGLPSYHDAFNKVFYQRNNPQSQHVNAIHFKGPADNNKMERINGEIRDREKTMRGLKKKDTPILQGMQIFHNYIRPHEGLNGKTPSEACGIEIKGENKWITLIQNASVKERG
jgi:putative transposase